MKNPVKDDQQPQRHKSSLVIYLMISNACFGAFFFGYQLGVYNGLQDHFASLFNWTKDEKARLDGLITGMIPLGAALGALLGSMLGGTLGRLKVLYLCDFISMIGIFSSAVKDIEIILIGRLLCGLGVGINSAVLPIYVNEMSPTELSGMTGSMIQLTINLGLLGSFLIGFGLPQTDIYKTEPDNSYWRFMFLFPIIVVAMRVIMFCIFFSYETPFFLMKSNKKEEALKVIKRLYKEPFVEEEVQELERKTQNRDELKFTDLLTKQYRKRFMIAIMLQVFQQVSGINAVIFYSQAIFKGGGGSDHDAKVFSVFIAILLTLAAFISGRLLDRLGRKTILFLGEFMITTSLGLLSLATEFEWKEFSKLFIFIFLFGFGISIGPIVMVYIPEIVPDKAVGLSFVANWLVCGVIGLAFPIMQRDIGMAYTFAVFCFTSFLGLLFVEMYVIETKGLTATEVEAKFANQDLEIAHPEIKFVEVANPELNESEL